MNGIGRGRGKVILSSVVSPISIILQREQPLGNSLHCCLSSFHFSERAGFPTFVPVFIAERHHSRVLADLWSNIKQSYTIWGRGRKGYTLCFQSCEDPTDFRGVVLVINTDPLACWNAQTVFCQTQLSNCF